MSPAFMQKVSIPLENGDAGMTNFKPDRIDIAEKPVTDPEANGTDNAEEPIFFILLFHSAISFYFDPTSETASGSLSPRIQ